MSWRTVAILLLSSLVACGLFTARSGPGARLRRVLRGRSRKWIAASLGKPLIVGLSNDTWYYPLDAERGQAIAIKFKRDIATSIEIIGPGRDLPCPARP